MKRITLGVALISAAMLSGCIVVPRGHGHGHGRYYGSTSVTVVDSPRYGGRDQGGRNYGPPPQRRGGW